MSDSSGGVDPTAPTELPPEPPAENPDPPVTGTGPTALPPDSDSSGGPAIPGSPGVPSIQEPPEGGFDDVPQALAAAAAASVVAIGLTAGAAAAPAVAAAAGGTAGLILIAKVLAEDEPDNPGQKDDFDDD